MLSLIICYFGSYLFKLLLDMKQVSDPLLSGCLELLLVKFSLFFQVRQLYEFDVLLLGQSLELRLELKNFLLFNFQILLESLLDVDLLVHLDFLDIE